MIKNNISSVFLAGAMMFAGLLLAPGRASAGEAPARLAGTAGEAAPPASAAVRASNPPPIEGIELGLPITGGSGCPAGTVSAALSPDYSKLSILYDAYVAQTTGDQSLVRRSCNVAVPMYIPPGLSVSVFRTDYRGYAFIPENGRGNFRAEYFFAGYRGPTVTRSFSEDFNEDFLLRDEAPLEVWSRCGDETIARINSSITAQRPTRSREQAIVAIDSMDISAEMEFYLRWRTCD